MPDTDRPKPRRAPLRMEVIRSDRVSPHMQRIVLGGRAFDEFTAGTEAHADRYVTLTFVHPEVTYGEPEVAYGEPLAVDPDARELTIDSLVHGGEGVAGP